MRNISPASLVAINQTSGLEPVIIVRVFWNGQPTSYADRKFETSGLIGRLLEISGIEDIVDINASASSVNMSVTLDDSDRSIKNVFDVNDIHKTYVQVLQWFSGIPLSDAFLIFEGEIASPIVWAEGTRTLKFDIVTRIEDREVGFSAEEAQFPFMASDLAGKAWPLVFGTVGGVPPLSLNESPKGVFAEGFGIVNDDAWEQQFDDLNEAIKKAHEQSDDAWIQGLNNAYKAGQFKGRGPGFTTFPDDASQADQYDTAASNYFAQSANFKAEMNKLLKELADQKKLQTQQKGFAKRNIAVTGSDFPLNVPFTIEFGNYTASAQVIGGNIVIGEPVEKVDVNAPVGTNTYEFSDPSNRYKKTTQKEKFIWIDGGTEFRVFNYPRVYIVSMGACTVINIYGHTKYGRAIVPPNYYIVDHPNLGGGLIATRLIFPTPLTSYPGFWEDGGIECDVVNPVGPNVVDIMLYVISLWGGYGVDVDSWTYVRTKVAPYPANFALTNRMNVVSFLKEVSFQSRCAIWLNDRKYFIRFLPEELAPVESISDGDVEVNSITVTSTETERLVTKFIAQWKTRIGQERPNEIIYRYNIQRYGTVEETYDFFIYNNFECVQVAAQFWVIRKANTFKLIQCKVMLNKLRIEAFDPVQFNFAENIVAYGPVTGLVTKSAFQPDDDSLAIEAWLPVRFGEMSAYRFAFPDSVQLIYPDATDPNIQTGNPFDRANQSPIANYLVPQVSGIQYSHGYPFTQGTGQVTNAAPDLSPLIVALDPREIKTTRPAGINSFNDKTKTTINAIVPFQFKATVPATFYGEVISKLDENRYRVDVYFTGMGNDSKATTVRIGQILAGTELPGGFPLTVVRTVYTITDAVGNTSIGFEYWAQPAIWVPPIQEEDV